jgi:nicotinamide-nucleotide amidase
MKHAEVAQLKKLTRKLAKTLTEHNLSIVTAESCTGGWLAKCCTDIAGSSAWFDRGFVTYSNASKQDMLNVNQQTLITHGAVSQYVAEEMAQGALNNSQADIAVAITGIAGPDGGTDDKPVGTVWITWAYPDKVKSQLFQFEGKREQIRYLAILAAISDLIENARDSAISVG